MLKEDFGDQKLKIELMNQVLDEKANKVYTDYHLEACIKKEALFDLKDQISKSVTKTQHTQVFDEL